MRHEHTLARLAIYGLLFLFAALFLMPFYVVIVTSLKTLPELRQGNMLALPEGLTFAAWAKAWGTACTGAACEGLRPFFMNSVMIVIPSVLISSGLGAINGYALSQWRFPGSEVIFTMLLFGFFIPFQAILLPAAQFLGFVGLANTIPGLIIIQTVYGIAFCTMLFRNYYVAIPGELVKAARVDGAGFFLIFRRIFLPLTLPIFMVCVIWQFTHIWNDFLFGVVFSGPDSRPITVGLNNLVNTSEGVKEYNVDTAAALITALPTLLVYIVGGRYFLRGLTAGAVKG
ncbi:carbohydrate ABC transporter permease [Aureimonas fodinaquatilis]|uniref:Carbohydrate ABC transporter permease n=1 Tax=Aureimonas fodinaquatilis TaxID=2565783 RepID=A0A5B0DUL8_9HYPH|nr:carbohydrate ABC transporter permease [Aureimonas fodinaquatilis]KAA0970156.1 carbohydrate ABC transporter permease [Aureimonas fodinaquatilis]